MAAGESVDIQGCRFTPTEDGTLRIEEVREQLEALAQRLAATEAENAELRGRLDHLDALRRLAESTVTRADELAAEIEAEARRRADALLQAAEAEIAERRHQFEAGKAAEVEALHKRANQLQAALDGAMRTLGDALQAMGSGAAPAMLAAASQASTPAHEAPAPPAAADRAAPAARPAEAEAPAFEPPPPERYELAAEPVETAAEPPPASERPEGALVAESDSHDLPAAEVAPPGADRTANAEPDEEPHTGYFGGVDPAIPAPFGTAAPALPFAPEERAADERPTAEAPSFQPAGAFEDDDITEGRRPSRPGAWQQPSWERGVSGRAAEQRGFRRHHGRHG